MTEDLELSISVRLSCQRALLGAIIPNIRLITVGWDNLNMFYLRAYYDVIPSENDIDDMNAVLGEIFADIDFKKDNGVECIQDIRPMKELELYKWVVYERKE